MVSSAANTVMQYLTELPLERRIVVAELRRVILENLPPGYVETMNWGMLAYEIPLARYPKTYNGKPLAYVCLAAQKSKFSLYLTGPYMFGEESETAFRDGFEAAGKKLDMGKSCVRFRRLEDLALNVLAASIASISVEDYIRQYEKVRAETKTQRKSAAKRAARPAAQVAGSSTPAKAAKQQVVAQSVAAKVAKKAAGKVIRKAAPKKSAPKKASAKTVKKVPAKKSAAKKVAPRKPVKTSAARPRSRR